MNYALLFERYDKNKVVKLLKKLYLFRLKIFRSEVVKYLRDAGATIGDNCYISRVDMLGSEPYLVTIGNNVYFSGSDIKVVTHDGATMQLAYMGYTDKKYDNFGRVTIGDNCFIGERTIILKGVHIGENCIIGAGSVVTKDIPDNCVAAGVPARVISTVEDWYKKNKSNYSDTFGWEPSKKREYLCQIEDL